MSSICPHHGFGDPCPSCGGFIICRDCGLWYKRWKWPYCKRCYKKSHKGMIPTKDEIKLLCEPSAWPVPKTV